MSYEYLGWKYKNINFGFQVYICNRVENEKHMLLNVDIIKRARLATNYDEAKQILMTQYLLDNDVFVDRRFNTIYVNRETYNKLLVAFEKKQQKQECFIDEYQYIGFDKAQEGSDKTGVWGASCHTCKSPLPVGTVLYGSKVIIYCDKCQQRNEITL